MRRTVRHRLRIITAEAHRIDHRPAVEFIIQAAFREGLAGAHAVHGIAGFGRSHRLHTTRLLDLSNDLPVIIEIIDERDRLESFAAGLRKQYDRGVITVDEVECWD